MKFDQAIANDICAKLMKGQSLRQVCRDELLPGRDVVYEWLAENKAFADQYARACEMRAEAIFDEMFEIADDGSNDWMKSLDEDGGTDYKLNGEHVQRSKLRIDARKWALSKMQPKKYGEKVDIEHSGGVAITSITRKIVDHKGE